MSEVPLYRGTSPISNSIPLGSYSSICLGPSGGPRGGGRFLMSEVPLYFGFSLKRFGCRANMTRISQSRPDAGLGFQAKVPKTL